MGDLTAGLTGTEAAVLLVLAAHVDAVRNPDLVRLGPALGKPSRERLIERGLLDVETGARRTLVLSLTDRGWAAAAELVESDPPAGAAPSTRALFSFAAGLGRYLRRESLALGEVMTPQAPEAAPHTPADLVRAAYHRAAATPGAWVALARLRAALDLPREIVDEALRELYPASGVDIVAEDNQKTLTAADHAAALRLGGRHLHAIRVTG